MGSTSQWTSAQQTIIAMTFAVPQTSMVSAQMNYEPQVVVTIHVQSIRPMSIVALMGLGVVAQQLTPSSLRIGAQMLIATLKMIKLALSLAPLVPTTGLSSAHDSQHIFPLLV